MQHFLRINNLDIIECIIGEDMRRALTKYIGVKNNPNLKTQMFNEFKDMLTKYNLNYDIYNDFLNKNNLELKIFK